MVPRVDFIWRYASGGLLVVFLIFLLAWTVPSGITLFKDHSDWNEKRRMLSAMQARLENVPHIERSVEELTSYVNRFSTSGRDSKATDHLSLIQNRAESAGLVQIELRPGVADTSGTLVSTLVEQRLLGDFISFGMYVAALENGPMPVRMESIDIFGTENSPNSISVDVRFIIVSDRGESISD